MSKYLGKTGQEWARILKVPIVEPTGWVSKEDYETRHIFKEEFCNRAANSRLEVNPELSRRGASKFGHRKLAINKNQ